MSTVEELIAAARAQQRPSLLSQLAQIGQSGMAGFSTGVKEANTGSETRLNIAKTILERQQAQQLQDQQAAQAKMQAEIEAQIGQGFKSGVNSGDSTGSTPAAKLKTKISQDEKGQFSRTYESVDAPTPTSLDALTAEKVRNGEMTLEEAYAMKRKGEASSADKPPAGYRYKGDGTLEAIPGGPGVKSPTEAQTNAGLFGTRAKEAQAQLDELSKGGFDPTAATTGIRNAIPDALGGNFVRTPQMQEFNQAGLNFLSAILRKESGAAISTGEYTMGRKQYLPQPGDDAATLEFKRKNRETAISQILAGAKQDGQGGMQGMIDANMGGGAPAPVAQPAPHGQRVKQGGKVYQWNGSSYEEAR